eukprot:365868-Chlamydomonas_euryale.AAC.3
MSGAVSTSSGGARQSRTAAANPACVKRAPVIHNCVQCGVHFPRLNLASQHLKHNLRLPCSVQPSFPSKPCARL